MNVYMHVHISTIQQCIFLCVCKMMEYRTHTEILVHNAMCVCVQCMCVCVCVCAMLVCVCVCVNDCSFVNEDS